MTRTSASCLAIAAFLLSGCPGSLENPERFGDAAVSCDAEELLATSCANAPGCHVPGNALGLVDLMSADIASRVVDVPAVICEGSGNLVDSADPQGASFLLEKTTPSPSCGARMPPAPAAELTAAEMNCLSAWADEVAAGGGTDAGTDGGGGDAGSDSGAGADASEGGV